MSRKYPMNFRLAAQVSMPILATTCALALANDPTTPQLRAHRIHSNIELDGVLSEAEWQQATTASSFLQYQPAEGEPATEKTEVHVLYNEANLFVGVRCFDSQPQRIVAQKLQRDSGLGDDDMFALAVDTYHDRRNAYFFAT